MKNSVLAALALPICTVSVSAYAVDYLSTESAQRLLFPKANRFSPSFLDLSDSQRDDIEKASGLRQRLSEQKVWKAQSKGTLLGWFLVDEVIGKHDFITYATALSPDGEVIGIEIMSYRETHGAEVREAAWRDHFKHKTLADPFKLNEDVPNISGATLSCRNVLDGVKRLLTIQKLYLRYE